MDGDERRAERRALRRILVYLRVLCQETVRQCREYILELSLTPRPDASRSKSLFEMCAGLSHFTKVRFFFFLSSFSHFKTYRN